jgi:hypothetical protein
MRINRNGPRHANDPFRTFPYRMGILRPGVVSPDSVSGHQRKSVDQQRNHAMLKSHRGSDHDHNLVFTPVIPMGLSILVGVSGAVGAQDVVKPGQRSSFMLLPLRRSTKR